MGLKTVDRFWLLVERSDSCWNWQGSISPKGYGRFRASQGSLAHRYAYELLIGRVPEGLILDHPCRNLKCVNPAHLEPVTHRVNLLRGVGIAAICARKIHCK